jgi:hypothetical protein
MPVKSSTAGAARFREASSTMKFVAAWRIWSVLRLALFQYLRASFPRILASFLLNEPTISLSFA